MDYIQLGQSDLRVSQLGFGGCPLGQHGWGDVSKIELLKAVRIAVDQGVNFFDTADVYGLGRSEENLKEALGSRRKDVLISTKFGVRRDKKGTSYYDNSTEWINTALDSSLRRLGTDYIDLYQVHYWDNKIPLDSLFRTLEEKRQIGKIRYYGITNINLSEFALEELPEGLISFSCEYSLANRENEKSILQMHNQNGLGFISWGSLGQGILSGKYSSQTDFSGNDRRSREIYKNFHEEKINRNLEIVGAMKEMSGSYPGRTLTQIAVRWILDYLKFGIALVGIKTPDQIIECVNSFGWKIRAKEVETLARL
jgi:myo-inositol catabolism protein IolS